MIKRFIKSIPASLVKKLLLIFISVFLSVVSAIMIFNYLIVKNNTENLVKDELKASTDLIYEMMDNAYEDFTLTLTNISKNNLDIANQLYDSNPANAKNLLPQILLSQSFGKSGYIYCIDSSGTIKIHPKKELIGTNIIRHDFAKKTVELKNGSYKYLWANPGEKEKKPKMVAFSYFERMDLYISVSVSIDEFMEKLATREMKIKAGLQTIKERLKSFKIGQSGYAYIINTDGDIIVHPTLEGQNFSDKEYIRHIIEKKDGALVYNWDGKDKIVAFRHFSQLDWIIVAGSNYEDFLDAPMKKVAASSALLIIAMSAITFLLFYKIINSMILKPILHAKEIAESIKSGKLDLEVNISGRDEIGTMMSAISEMLRELREIISTVMDNIHILNTTSGALSGISERMNAISRDQAASMEESSAALEENLASMEQISEKASLQYSNVEKNAGGMTTMARNAQDTYDEAMRVSGIMLKTSDEARTGQEDLNQMVTEMQNIKESTVKIAEIIKIISDISEQVNLLSLNAAIEAARAGENGRGFAVVADEISKLADQTAASAKNITSLVAEGSQRADSGMRIVNNTASTFHKIIETIQIVNSSMGKFSDTLKLLAEISSTARGRTDSIKQISSEIAASSNEQMKINKEISDMLDVLSREFQTLVGYSEKISGTSGEIDKISADLKSHMIKFRTGADQ